MIFLVINDRIWRVEVGCGFEGVILDVLSNRVMELVVKLSFIEGKYGEGFLNLYSVFCDYIVFEYNVILDKFLNILVLSNIVVYNNNFKFFGIVLIGLLLLDFIFNRGRILFIIF